MLKEKSIARGLKSKAIKRRGLGLFAKNEYNPVKLGYSTRTYDFLTPFIGQ